MGSEAVYEVDLEGFDGQGGFLNFDLGATAGDSGRAWRLASRENGEGKTKTGGGSGMAGLDDTVELVPVV